MWSIWSTEACGKQSLSPCGQNINVYACTVAPVHEIKQV